MSKPIIGYGGDCANGPENTLGGVREAFLHGADRVMVDVRSTSDGEPVLMRDRTVDRTTDGVGSVDAMGLPDLRKLDAGFWHSAKYMGEPIPTLRDTLQWAAGKIAVDVRLPGGDNTAACRMLPAESTVYSSDPQVLARVKESFPLLRTGLMIEPSRRHQWTMAAAASLVVGAVTALASGLKPLPTLALTALAAPLGYLLQRRANQQQAMRAALQSNADILVPPQRLASPNFVSQAHANGQVVFPIITDASQSPQADGLITASPALFTNAAATNSPAALQERCEQALLRQPGVSGVVVDGDTVRVSAASAEAAEKIRSLVADRVGHLQIAVEPAGSPSTATPSRADMVERYKQNILALPGVYAITPDRKHADGLRLTMLRAEDQALVQSLLRDRVEGIHIAPIKVPAVGA